MKRVELLNQISALKTEKRTSAITPQRVGSILQEMATITPESSMPGDEDISEQLTQLFDQMQELTHNYDLTLLDYNQQISQNASDIKTLRAAHSLSLVRTFDGITAASAVVDGAPESVTATLKIVYNPLQRRFLAGPLDGKYYTQFADCEKYNDGNRARLGALYMNSTTGSLFYIDESYMLHTAVSEPDEDDYTPSTKSEEMILPFHGVAATSAAATTVGAIYYNSTAKAFYTKKSSTSFEVLQDERYNVNIGVLGATVHANPNMLFRAELMTGAVMLCFAKDDGSLFKIETTAV